MAIWNVDVEWNGYNINDEMDFPNDFTAEDVYQMVLDEIMIDVTREA